MIAAIYPSSSHSTGDVPHSTGDVPSYAFLLSEMADQKDVEEFMDLKNAHPINADFVLVKNLYDQFANEYPRISLDYRDWQIKRLKETLDECVFRGAEQSCDTTTSSVSVGHETCSRHSSSHLMPSPNASVLHTPSLQLRRVSYTRLEPLIDEASRILTAAGTHKCDIGIKSGYLVHEAIGQLHTFLTKNLGLLPPLGPAALLLPLQPRSQQVHHPSSEVGSSGAGLA